MDKNINIEPKNIKKNSKIIDIPKKNILAKEETKKVKKVEKSEKNYAPVKLEILFTVVPREKGDIFASIIQDFEVNAQFILQGSGTANKDILRELGIEDSRKAVIISIVKETKTKEILSKIDDSFKTIRNSKGVSWSIPIDSLIGVLIYRFLTNNRGEGEL